MKKILLSLIVLLILSFSKGSDLQSNQINVTPDSLYFGDVRLNDTSNILSFNISAYNLSDSIKIKSPIGYYISTSYNGIYTNS